VTLDDPGAIAVLRAALDVALAEKGRRDARLAELEPLKTEYQLLENERANEGAGKSSISGLRTQLAFALLYREVGPPAQQPAANLSLP
jgi:hypothetical protein